MKKKCILLHSHKLSSTFRLEAILNRVEMWNRKIVNNVNIHNLTLSPKIIEGIALETAFYRLNQKIDDGQL